MELPQTVAARFLRRENRFRVAVELEGREVAAHLPNSGRLGELLTPGKPCYLVERSGGHRKTDYDLLLISHAGVLVSVDARLPNPLFAEAVAREKLAPFAGAPAVATEVHHGSSRLDFRLEYPTGPVWVETKSVTLVEEGRALFPDAPTLRGQRHLKELLDLTEEGQRAAVVFVIQRADAREFAPHAKADPAFAQTLARAHAAGVEVYAFRCAVNRRMVRIETDVPVRLNLC